MGQVNSRERSFVMVFEENVCNFESSNKGTGGLLNFDVDSYEFDDLDLEIAASRLSKRDRGILILYLMGHTQEDIGRIYDVTRSMISKRFRVIMDKLNHYLC